MFELLTGKHPVLLKGEDKPMYKQKMKQFTQLNFSNTNMSTMAKNLLERLCQLKPSSRYKVEQALAHPWITRNPNDFVPLTKFEENIF